MTGISNSHFRTESREAERNPAPSVTDNEKVNMMFSTRIRSFAIACTIAVTICALPAASQTSGNDTRTSGVSLPQYMAVPWEGEGYLITENGGRNWRLVYGDALSSLPEPIVRLLKSREREGIRITSVASPNPASGPVELRFSANEPGEVLISLHDVHGAEILRERHMALNAGISAHRFNVSSLPSGTYYYRLVSGSGHIGSGMVTVAR